MTTNRITIEARNGVWHAVYSGPHAEMILDAFGGDTIPTAFTTDAPRAAVVRGLQALNRNAIVE